MKKLFYSLILFFFVCFNISASCIYFPNQPEKTDTSSCPIIWPESPMNFSECKENLFSGIPSVDVSCSNPEFFSWFSDDTHINDPMNNCIQTIRTWKVLDWKTGVIFENFQILKYDINNSTICKTEMILNLDNGSLTISPKLLITNPNNNELYSFSKTFLDTAYTLTKNNLNNEVKYVYNLSTGDVCAINIKKSYCADASIFVRSQFEESVNGNSYRITEADCLKKLNNPCDDKISNFSILNAHGLWLQFADYDYETYKGQIISTKIRFRYNGINQEYEIKTKLLEHNLAPIELSVFDDEVKKNEVYKIVFNSSNFENINGLQMGLKFIDATYVNFQNGELNNTSINPSLSDNRFVLLWIPNDAKPISLTAADTLFSINILPQKDGKVSDFIKLDNSFLTSEAYYENPPDFISLGIELRLQFNQRLSATNDNNNNHQFQIMPNPIIDGDYIIRSETNNLLRVKWFDHFGRLLSSTTILPNQSNTLETNLSQGLYWILIEDGLNQKVEKVMILK